MKRRKLLKGILFGSSGLVLSASTVNLLTGCETFEDYEPIYFSKTSFNFLAQLCEIIIPETDSPGAITLKIPQFIDILIGESYTIDEQKKFTEKFKLLVNDYEQNNKKPIEKQSLEDILNKFSTDFKNLKNKSAIDEIRGLTVWGFKTSKEIATKILNYNPIPGYQKGCINLNELDNQNSLGY